MNVGDGQNADIGLNTGIGRAVLLDFSGRTCCIWNGACIALHPVFV